MTARKITSVDGAQIAFETTGRGEPLILVGGAFSDRHTRVSGTPLASLLADYFTVYSYDRRHRGDSSAVPPDVVEREVDDLAALLAAAGGSACVFGNSSGGLLALDAAARGLSISKLAVLGPPLILDGDRATAFEGLAIEVATAAREGRRADAVELFLSKAIQMPAAAIAQMRGAPVWPGLERLAHTLAYDLRITALGPERLARAASISARTRVIVPSVSPPWLRDALGTLAATLPAAQRLDVEVQGPEIDTRVLAPLLREFFAH